MKYYLGLILFFLFGCASQKSPTGGPVDAQGPKFIQSTPATSQLLAKNDKITLFFDEKIDPISVVNSVEILNFDDFNYKIRGNRIIISPIHEWPNFDVIKVKLSRKISDFHNNMMLSPLQLFYFTKSFKSNKMIEGSIINFNNYLFELGLYKIDSNKYNLIEKTQSDHLGNFNFLYLAQGNYIVAAVEDRIENIKYDIRKKTYGFINEDYIDLFNQDTVFVSIRADQPLGKLSIQSFRQYNNNFGYLLFNNGQEMPFILPWKETEGQNYVPGDSIFISIDLQNRIEKYTTPEFKIILSDMIDTTAPNIVSSKFINNKLNIIFNEPIQKWKALNEQSNIYLDSPKLFYFKDSILSFLEYQFIDPLTIELEYSQVDSIYISNIHDIYNNINTDTLLVNTSNDITSLNSEEGGNIYGEIEYSGTHPIIIKAESINLENIYYEYMDQNNEFNFLNIKPSLYNFIAYEILGDYDSTQYFSGLWEPFQRAAKFGIYSDTLEVRNNWDIKNMLLADQLNIKIIKGKGNFKGGSCIIKEESIIVINKNKPFEDCIKNLALSLLEFNLSNIEIDSNIQSMLNQYKNEKE